MTDSGGKKVRRLERMLRGECCKFDLGLSPDDITVEPDGSVAPNGASGTLELQINLSPDLLYKLAPPLDPKVKGSPRSDSALQRFVRAMGETARRLGPENGWPERHVQVMELSTLASWSG
ncbi:MAG: hypothetical protein WCW04_03755 [Candidatus Paceibacterota bacterium]|jgi:hypothetical protein